MLKKLLLICIVIFTISSMGIAFAAAGNPKLRVAIVENQSTLEIIAGQEFSVNHGGQYIVLPKGKYIVHLDGEKIAFDAEHVFQGRLKLTPGKNDLLEINKHSYKGDYTLETVESKLLMVNHVALESYLESVLPAKTMVVWPDETIKAQAVAARSYALHEQAANGAKRYDLRALDSELRYEGTGKRIEKHAVTKLIKATQGQYLADAAGAPILAVTTSSTGGRTEAAAAAWEREISYLQSREDDDSDSPDHTWQQVVTPVLLENYLVQRGENIGTLTSVRLSTLDAPDSDRTETGRVRYLFIGGSAGSLKISGQEIVEILGLPSTLFDVETGTPVPDSLNIPIENRYGMTVGSKEIDIRTNAGNDKPVWKNMMRSYHMLSGAKDEKLIFRGKGRGSGVGMSAWGARALANANAKTTYADILAYYYPGTVLVK